MAARPYRNPHVVDWSGENPGMYLRESADGPYVTLVSFARVVLSPFGRGHAAIVVLDPTGDGTDPERPNLCITDNPPLARWLIDDYVRHFLAFRGLPSLATLKTVAGWDFEASSDSATHHTERFVSTEGHGELVWSDWGDRWMVELTDAQAVTGKHDMFSMFVDVRAVGGHVGGRKLRGQPFPRAFAGKPDSSTAFLAFSETWVRAE